jgi:hypothetical protein
MRWWLAYQGLLTQEMAVRPSGSDLSHFCHGAAGNDRNQTGTVETRMRRNPLQDGPLQDRQGSAGTAG